MDSRLERLVPAFLDAELDEKQAWIRQVRILADPVFDEPGALEEFGERVRRSATTLRRWKRCNVFTDAQLQAPLMATVYTELVSRRRPDLIERAIAEQWDPDTARIEGGGADKHGLSAQTLLDGLKKKPELYDVIVRDPDAAAVLHGAQLRAAAERDVEYALRAPAFGEAPRLAVPPSPWAALWSGLASLSQVADRMTDTAWDDLSTDQIRRVGDESRRAADLLVALSGAADDRLLTRSGSSERR